MHADGPMNRNGNATAIGAATNGRQSPSTWSPVPITLRRRRERGSGSCLPVLLGLAVRDGVREVVPEAVGEWVTEQVAVEVGVRLLLLVADALAEAEGVKAGPWLSYGTLHHGKYPLSHAPSGFLNGQNQASSFNAFFFQGEGIEMSNRAAAAAFLLIRYISIGFNIWNLPQLPWATAWQEKKLKYQIAQTAFAVTGT